MAEHLVFGSSEGLHSEVAKVRLDSQRGKQTFTLNTVFILTRHLEAMAREAGFCDDENAMDGKEVLGKLPRSH